MHEVMAAITKEGNRSCIAKENISPRFIKEFSAEEVGLLIKAIKPDWKIPDNVPYQSDAYFGVIQLIIPN